jgi:hypothetical protein
MDIQKAITLMGDRLHLSFLVKDTNTFNKGKEMLWIENIFGKVIDMDSYDFIINPDNKKEVKKELKIFLPNQKGLYKELMLLLNKMKEYEV